MWRAQQALRSRNSTDIMKLQYHISVLLDRFVIFAVPEIVHHPTAQPTSFL
jgi:hypothetical protein